MALPTYSLFPRAFGVFEPSLTLSGDARFLAYASFGDGTRLANVFIHDTLTGTMRLVTSGPGAFLIGNDNFAPVLAGAGAALAFTTAAPDGVQQIAVADLAGAGISFASSAADGAAGNGDSRFAAISANARFVAFESAASNLVAGDTNGADDVFVKDMHSGAVRRVSLSAGGVQFEAGAGSAQISADGNVVLFQTLGEGALYASNLASGALTLVAQDNAGQAALSADGRYVVFSSAASLTGDTNGNYDVFRKDLFSGVVQQVSTSAASTAGVGWSSDPSISADGRFVSFSYDGGDLTGGPVVGNSDIYIKDMLTGGLRQVSFGADAAQGSFFSDLSANGAHVAYASYAGQEGADYDVSWNVTLAKLAPASIAAASMTSTSGSAGSDMFMSSAHNESWSAGAGFDIAAFHGKLADYAINAGANGVQVEDSIQGRDGSDLLNGVERLRFADSMLALDTVAPEGVAGQAYRIYQAAFNRAPDQAGLGYWIAAMDQGQPLQAVAQGFVQSAEFIALYGSAPTNAQVVDKLYLNVLHRAGEAGGVAYWNSILDNGHASVAAVLASFSESAENIAALIGVLDDGVAYLPFG